MNAPRLGPAVAATIITNDLDHSIGLYCDHLDQRVFERGELGPAEAGELGWRGLTGARTAWLANALEEPWLRFIEAPDAPHNVAFTHYGWLSLEIAVEDVDALGEALVDSPFHIIGPPADLAMSDAIRAMQVVGPSGEVLYLTEVKRPVPPFEIPQARCPVDRLFIPVMMCPNREAALAHYSDLSGNSGMSFDTKITVINRAKGYDIEHQHPVATIQLAGETLIELDQVTDLAPAPFHGEAPPTGIALVHFQHAVDAPELGTGAAGERYRLQPLDEGTPS